MSIRDAVTSAEQVEKSDGLSWYWGVRYDVFAPEWVESGYMLDHWRESGTFNDTLPMDCDHRYFRGLEQAGLLDILVVRDRDGEMIAYMILIKQRYSRSRHATAGTIDMIYVAPRHRTRNLGGGLGWRMMRAAVDRLREGGVNLAFFREKLDHRGGHLRRLGFEQLSTTWGQVLNHPRRIA